MLSGTLASQWQWQQTVKALEIFTQRLPSSPLVFTNGGTSLIPHRCVPWVQNSLPTHERPQ